MYQQFDFNYGKKGKDKRGKKYSFYSTVENRPRTRVDGD